MKKIIAASILFIGCGEPSSKIVHPVIDPVQAQYAPLLENDLVQKRWVAKDNEDFVMVDIEHRGTERNDDGTDKLMFHFRLCGDITCTDLKYFFVGIFKLQDGNDMCFSNITYWQDPPPDFFMQVKDVAPSGSTFKQAEDFCGFGFMVSDTLNVKIVGENETKTLEFKATNLSW